MKTKILNKTKNLWTYPPENWEQVVYWWKNDLPITFYSWECPPRKVTKIDSNQSFVDFDVDVRRVVRGEKIDRYTEIPRVNTRMEEEKWFVQQIINKNPNAFYVKLIADTNAKYLYPAAMRIIGESRIEKIMKKFEKELRRFSQINLNRRWPEFLLFTNVQKEYKKEYDAFFNLVFESFGNDLRSEYVSYSLIRYWENRIIKHVGLDPKKIAEKQDLLKRVIASYAAEGMIFFLADKEGILPNPVWLNWEENPFSGQTTEILRQRYGIGPIPKVYLVKGD